MNKDKEISEILEDFKKLSKDELLQFHRKRLEKFYRTLGLFTGILSFSVLIGIGFLGDKFASLRLTDFSHLFELIATLSFSLVSGTLTTYLKMKSKKEVKSSTLKEFIKHTYLSKLEASSLNPQTTIVKQ